MTTQQKADLNYLTQYANDMSDEQLFDRIDNKAAYYDLDLDLFIEIAEMMTVTPDTINEILFNLMLKAESDADLEDTIKILIAIDNEDIAALNDLLDNQLDVMMFENNINVPSFWIDQADYDLRENGINADAINYANDIDESAEFLQLTPYNNFNRYSFIDLVVEFFDEYY